MKRQTRSRKVLAAAFAVTSIFAMLQVTSAAESQAPRTVEITVTDRGYEPSRIELVTGEPVRLAFSNRADSACAASVTSATLGVETTKLPKGKTTIVTVVPEKAGEFTFACEMGMLEGSVIVESAASAKRNWPP